MRKPADGVRAGAVELVDHTRGHHACKLPRNGPRSPFSTLLRGYWYRRHGMSGTRSSSRRFGNTAGRMDLRRLQEIAARYGLDVMFIVDQKDDERVPRDTPVIVSQFTRGVGTENIAQYRTTSVGYLKAHGGFAANPEHVGLDFKGGYRISDSHFADWHFFLEGKPAHPEDEPRTPWARLGAYEWTRDGRRVRHTEAYALAQAMQDAATSQHSSRHAMAAGEPVATAGRRRRRVRRPPPRLARRPRGHQPRRSSRRFRRGRGRSSTVGCVSSAQTGSRRTWTR